MQCVYAYILYGANKSVGWAVTDGLTTCQFLCLTAAIKSVLNNRDILDGTRVVKGWTRRWFATVFFFTNNSITPRGVNIEELVR